jgi:Phage tail lysozyme
MTATESINNWTEIEPDQRIRSVMNLLTQSYQYPVNGAAGIVGNLWAESGVLPNRIEGSQLATPWRSKNFQGQWTDFTAEQVMNRHSQKRQGPRYPGIGLAQWTSAKRRRGLFEHLFQGRPLGAAILFNLEAQVDYLVTELQGAYAAVNAILIMPDVTVNAASDEVVYGFETPGALLSKQGRRLARHHPNVQAVFAQRRVHAQRALQVFITALLTEIKPPLVNPTDGLTEKNEATT